MPKKSLAVAFLAALLMLLAAPLVLAQTGDMPVMRPDPNDPYLIFISNDQAIYCGHAVVVGSPIYDFCIQNGITPPVMYNPDGTLAGFLQYSGSDNTDLCITPQEFAWRYGAPLPPVNGDACAHGRVQ